LPVLLSQAVVIPQQKTIEGELIVSVTLPLLAIINRLLKEPAKPPPWKYYTSMVFSPQ
jgi:hypothetical protein